MEAIPIQVQDDQISDADVVPVVSFEVDRELDGAVEWEREAGSEYASDGDDADAVWRDAAAGAASGVSDAGDVVV